MTGPVLIWGSGGQVGHDLRHTAWPSGMTAIGLPRAACPITDADAVATALDTYRPTIAVNAGAYTAVDQAETDRDTAFAVNRDGPAILAAACRDRQVPLIHLSTDYVFDGTKTGTYTEEDPIGPLGVYGASKAAGEQAVRDGLPDHVILRTSWVFGAEGRNFVKSILKLATEREELRIVSDQIGGPTPAADIAAAIATIVQAIAAGHPRWGTFHYAGDEAVSWYDFAREIVTASHAARGRSPRLTAIPTSEYPTPARRPLNSRLDCSRLGHAYGIVPAAWRRGLRQVLSQLEIPVRRDAQR